MSNQYEHYFLISDRLSSKTGKVAKVIDPNQFDAFLLELENDPDLPIWFKAMVACGLSLGTRVSEVLSIKKEQILADGTVIGINVLKKRQDGVKRNGMLHPTAQRILSRYCVSKRSHEYLFAGIPRQRVHRWVKRIFGSDPHALFRHSFVSFLVHKGKEGIVIARILKLSSVAMAYQYSHISVEREMRAVYAQAA